MKYLIVIGAALVCLAFVSCASVNQTANRVCTIYTDLKPDVIALRAVIAKGFDSYPPDVQAKLRKLDGYLPELDQIGAASCAFESFDRDRALTILVDVAKIAAELKGKGVV